jgi:hypothetical protein
MGRRGLARFGRDGPILSGIRMSTGLRYRWSLGDLRVLRRYSDIVKRECGRVGSESWSGSVMFGKHKVAGPERVLSPVFL